MGNSDFLMGSDPGFEKTNVLTGGQNSLLNNFTGLSNRYIGDTTGALAGMAMAPTSAYSQVPGWEQQFRQGVERPMNSRMQKDLEASQHSNMRHSSANVKQQQNIRNQYSDQIAQMRYQQMMQERQMQMSGLENAFQRQQSALGSMNNFYATGLNRNSIQTQYQGGSSGLLGGLASSAAGAGMSYLTSGILG